MTAASAQDWARFATSPLLWIGLTLAAYLFAQWLYRRSGGSPLLIPVFTAAALVVDVLWLSGTPNQIYAHGTQLLTFLVGPATSRSRCRCSGTVPGSRPPGGRCASPC